MRKTDRFSSEVSRKSLANATYDLDGWKATWVASVPVKETFERETVWEGFVEVLNLQGHPTASRCYD
jgi:hypothetical protein